MKWKSAYWRLESKFYKICGGFLRWLPIQSRKIVLNNFYGKGYGDSPKYIAEEIIRQKLPYDLVWLADNFDSQVSPIIRKVKLHSLQASYELSTAKVIISNVKVKLPYYKKNNQFYLQTWHGSVAFKAIEADAQDKLDINYVKESKADSKLINLFLSSNSIQTYEIKNSFWYDGEILESGSPRNDIFFAPKDIVRSIKLRMGIPDKNKIILYAPTFRDSQRVDVFNIDLRNLKESLDVNTEDNWHIIIRLHPNIQDLVCFGEKPFVTDMTHYPDMQEILLISDALVTDYSTIIYDMAIMHKPIFLYAPDIDDYKGDRGLKPIYFDIPTRICTTNDELISYVRNFNYINYQRNLLNFLSKIEVYDDGHASERVVDRINRETNIFNR